jgi:tetratricopeptide (TPR) repeat protein
MLCRHYWLRFRETAGLEAAALEYSSWAARGLGIPVLLWTTLNTGLSSWMPPLMPVVHRARDTGGDWVPLLLAVLGPSLMVVGFFWGAATLGWLLALTPLKSVNRADFRTVCVFWALLLSPLAWFLVSRAGVSGVGPALLAWLWPVTHFTLPLIQTEKPLPSYSRAVAKIKFGKYADAEWEVLKELEKCSDDVEGWLMLAELYAVHFHDLPEADRTIIELCDQPNVSGAQIALALHRLADWHLKLADDPRGARRAMEAICLRLPGSYFAREAQQRLCRLPATREELRELRQPKPLRLPALSDALDEPADQPAPEVSPEEATRHLNQLIARLRQDPNDVPTREKLARLLAEQLQKTDVAIEQLELLLALPGQPEFKMAEWLSLMAAWRLRRGETAAAIPILERLVHDYPQSSQAFAAQRRLYLLGMEERLRRASPGRAPRD